MRRRREWWAVVLLGVFLGAAGWLGAQRREPRMPVVRVRVDMVQLDVAVRDHRGYYVTGLSPRDFAVYEDNIRQKIATFGEEEQAPRKLGDFQDWKSKIRLVKPFSKKDELSRVDGIDSRDVASNIFVLFDTSNYMYRDFTFAQDAISSFVRYLNHRDKVAFYSYSRDLTRVCQLTGDRAEVLQGVRRTVAGDQAALYDALLKTLRYAGEFSGRRAVVVFSNGPDDASVASPEDVRDLAQSEGIPIYMVCTREAEDDTLSSAIFKRIAVATGGQAYFAGHWRGQRKAFDAIRDDLAHLYTLSYYPKPNPNLGWRTITVKLLGKKLQKYHVRTRTGYRPPLVWSNPLSRTAVGDGTPLLGPPGHE